MASFTLWLRWSLRDLRQRWLQVAAIALVIALGTGAYSGLGSSRTWRRQSYDRSYAMLNMYDLKVELTPGSYLEASELARVIDRIEGVQEHEARLSLPTFVDASTPERTIAVPGRVVGVDLSSGGPAINRIHVTAGRDLEAADAGTPVCIVEHHFADYYDLQPGDRQIQVRGGLLLEPVGTGMSPEYFMVVTEEGGMMAEASFAALFVPLKTAQEMAGLPGMVNDVLITVTDDADVDSVEQALAQALSEQFPHVGSTLEQKAENQVLNLLYEDASNDQVLLNTFAFLLLIGAALGSFTLLSRMVESQRREIGINMALGVPPFTIARRYLFAAAQIAFLGTLLGLAAGAVLSRAYGNLVRGFLPMPYMETPLQMSVFLQGALLGIVVPLLAVIYPIWRAVRVPPIETIQAGHLIAAGGGLAPFLARLNLPGSSVAQFPLRNLSRNPRRTLLTIGGIAMAVTLLIITIGMLDSMRATLAIGRQEHLQDVEDRMLVTLEGPVPAGQLPNFPQVANAEPLLTLPGTVSGPSGQTFDVIVQLMELENDLWAPTVLREDSRVQGPAVLIAKKAARDLGVEVGDTITLKHPFRETALAYRMKESQVQVRGIHGDVLRFYVYMDIEDAGLMNLAGLVNGLQINPAPGVERTELQRQLSRVPAVASVRSVSTMVDVFDELIEMAAGMFSISQYVALLLAFLIAFNTTSLNVEERRREIATMFAFGTPVRTVIRMAVVENLLGGILSTICGIGVGWVVLNQLLGARVETMVPEFGLLVRIGLPTLATVALFGLLAVALTPLLTVRKLVRMDLPSTLRVVE